MTASAKLSLNRDTLRIACVVDGDLELVESVIVAAVELANAAAGAIDLAPADLDPIVLRRYHLAELAAARDAFIEAAGGLLVGEVPAGQTTLGEEERNA